MKNTCIFCRTPPITPTASPKSAWACPGGCAHKGLARSRPRKPHILLHGRVAAVEAMLGAEPVVNRLAVCRCFGGARDIGRRKALTSVSPEASCEQRPAAPRTDTSSLSCSGSSRKHGRLHDGSYPRQRRNVGLRHSCPRRTSPVPLSRPERGNLTTGRSLLRHAAAPAPPLHWPTFSPPLTKYGVKSFVSEGIRQRPPRHSYEGWR